MKTSIHKIRIGIGEGAVVKAPGVIIAEGLGSCVALALYDVKHGLGGMVHILLPSFSECENRKKGEFFPYRYADLAIDALLEELQGMGAHNIVAKMAGGARMFPVYDGTGMAIGEQNIAQIRHILKKRLVPLAGEDVGGSHGRSAEFHVGSGKVIVISLGKEPLEI